MANSEHDHKFMQTALDLASLGRGSVEPNPMVGCVLVKNGRQIASGYHRKFGEAHAEVDALRSLSDIADAEDTTAYVTLEPCCHHGKTPPCTQALIDAKVKHVVVAMSDPFKEVDGGGLQQLRAAGIETTVGVLERAAQSLNAPYLKRVSTGLPYVIAKYAMTADGHIATVGGESQWITGEKSRKDVHNVRGRVDAIIVGMGTVESDDPQLTARPAGCRVATRVVFCRHRLPAMNSNLVRSIDHAPLLIIAGPDVDETQKHLLQQTGASIVDCQSSDQMVTQALQYLGANGATNVIVEGGQELLGSFLQLGQIDELHVYIGAKIFGGKEAPSPIGGRGVLAIADAMSLRIHSVDQYDNDLRVVYRRVIKSWT